MAAAKKYENLHELMILKLQSLYDVETVLLGVLPKMLKSSSDENLRAAFDKHLGETENHVTRIEQALNELKEKPRKEKVEAIRGLEKDAAWVVKNIKNDPSRDALLIATAQYVEHYEMAGYGTVLEWAELMEHSTVAGLIESTLGEEKAANTKLNELAKEGVNQRANIGMTPMEKLGG
jgi:ferritin-like metal-binding protein YciE